MATPAGPAGHLGVPTRLVTGLPAWPCAHQLRRDDSRTNRGGPSARGLLYTAAMRRTDSKSGGNRGSGLSTLLLLLLLALAGLAGGCGGALPHRLAAPPIAGTLEVDVLRHGAWESVPATALTLESRCSLRVAGVRQDEVVRVRYTTEPSVACSPAAPSTVQVADARR